MDIQIYLNIWFGGFITQNTLLGKLLHCKFFYVFHETLDKFFVFTQPHVTTLQEGKHVFMYTLRNARFYVYIEFSSFIKKYVCEELL